jgi:hypothetical protein
MIAYAFWVPFLVIAFGLLVLQVIRFVTGDRSGATRFLSGLAGATAGLLVVHAIAGLVLFVGVWIAWAGAGLLLDAPMSIRWAYSALLGLTWLAIAVFLTWVGFRVGLGMGIALHDGVPISSVWADEPILRWLGRGLKQ